MAANKLLINIALEGGKEIEKQLEGIGEAGKKAFGVISTAAEQAGGFKNLDLKEVQTELEKTGAVGSDAINKIVSAVQQAAGLESLVGGVKKVETAFIGVGQAVKLFHRVIGPIGLAIGAVGAAFSGIVASAVATAQAVTAVNTEAMKLGLTVEQFDKLRRGFLNAGISADAAVDGIKTFAGEIEKLKLAQATKNFEELKKAAEEGFSGAGSKALRELKEAANGVGAAAVFARDALRQLGFTGAEAQTDLQKLGIVAKDTRGQLLRLGDPIPPEGAQGIKNLASAAFNAATILPQVIKGLAQMPDSAERTAIATRQLGGLLGTQLVQDLQTGGRSVDQLTAKYTVLTKEAADNAFKVEQAANRLKVAWTNLGEDTSASPFLTGVLDAATFALNRFTAALSESQELSKRNQSAFMLGLEAMGIVGENFWQRFGEHAATVWQQIVSFVTTPVADAWQWIADTFNAVIQAVIDAASAAAAALKQLLPGGSGGGGAAPAPGGQGFAGGGRVGGRGSGTSDSNLAWVSRGEHIMPARAVGQPGVLAFLEALRRSGGNLRQVLDGMGRFALGGVVPSGGLGGMSNVTIQFPGLPAIGGLRASADVVEELRKAAAMAQVRSGGRKPSRYR